MKTLRVLGVLLLVVLVLGAAVYVMRARRRGGPGQPLVTVFPRTDAPRVPSAARGARIRVQVLNTTRTRGLARRATRVLRAQGFDVVEMGTTSPTIDTTLVLDRSGHPEWAAAVSTLIAPSRAVTRRDSSRYLDITVLLGRTWRPPAEPFDP